MWWSNRPQSNAAQKVHLLRAIYDWLAEEGLTAHLMVAQPQHWVSGVPERFLQEEHLVLNIKPQAVHQLQITAEHLHFHTRFSGQSHHVWVDLAAVEALFAAEDGQGICFDLGDDFAQRRPEKAGSGGRRPAFKRVK